MNKNAFLSELSRKLRRLPKEDFEDAMNYYNEYFLDAGVDDTTDVTPLVGTVDEVAKTILDDCTEKQFEKVKTEGGVKNSTKAVWLVILGIFAAPVALPLAIAAAAVVFALLITIFAVVFSLVIASAAIAFAGLVAIPAIFWATTPAQGMVVAGFSLMGIAIGILFCIAFYKLGELIVKGIIKLIRNISKSPKSSKRPETVQSVRTDVEPANETVEASEPLTEEEVYQQGGEV